MSGKIGIGGVFEIECYDKDGELKWKDDAHNMWVQEGRDYILNVIFKNGTRNDPLYVGLFEQETPSDDWTMSNNGTTWHENTDYSESARQEFIDGDISGTTTRQLDNDDNIATFSITASATLKGAFLTTDNTKGGTSGTLLCAATFDEGDRNVTNGDTVKVKYTVGCQDA